MKNILRIWLFAAVLLSATCIYAHTVDAPYLTGRVTDNAQIISDETRKTITERLKAHENRTTNQIAVLTVPSLDGIGVEEYAAAVFSAWKLGQKGKDNGILFLVAPHDRRVRIEVGYGLEGFINDGLAGGIIRDTMTPYFKKGDYDSGIENGIKEIILLLEGGLAQMEDSSGAARSKNPLFHLEAPDMSLTERILIGAFVFTIIGLFTVIGVLTPGIGWFLYFFLIPFWAMFPIIVVGPTGALYLLTTYLIVFPVAKLLFRNSQWYEKAAKDLKTRGSATIGGFTVTSGGSGSSGSSWSSGSSGFSGGGGSSGGGGASGSW
jgi:uncharacterized protein